MTKNKSRNPHTKKGGRTLTSIKASAKVVSGSKTKAAAKSATTKSATTKMAARKTTTQKTSVTAAKPAAKNTTSRKNTKAAANTPSITERVVSAVENLKGKDIVCMDVRKLTDVTDTLIIVSGTSNRHVKSLADNAMMELKKSGKRAYNIEGAEAGEWVLVDFGDVVLHVMQPHIREFYDLEKLWGTPAGDNGSTNAADTIPANKKPVNKKPPAKKPADKSKE